MIGSVQAGVVRVGRSVCIAAGVACCVISAASAAQVGPVVPDTAPVASAATVTPTDPPPAQATIAREAQPVWVLPETERLPLGMPEGPSDLVSSADTPNPESKERLPAGTLRTMLALGGVLLLIGALAWVFKRVARMSGGLAGAVGAGGRAPAGLVEVLARYPLGTRQTLVVLRFDRRVLLCSMSGGGRGGAGAMTTLCELDDPEDVASVLIKTRDEAGDSISRTFERAMSDADRYADRRDTPEPIKVRVPAGYAQSQRAYAEQSNGPLARGIGSILRGRGS